MCGIAGLLLQKPRSVDRELVARISQRLRHRGPDDCGYLTLGKGPARASREYTPDPTTTALLVHQRLSIIDLSRGGWQPMKSPDGRYYIAYNGEIYNYIELKRELESSGAVFHTTSDTEVVIAALARWGTGALSRFKGMFAIAFLDTRDRKLLLARDPFGIKPLYFTNWQDGFAFASEIKPLLDLPGVGRQIDPGRAFDYLRFGLTDHGDGSLLASIRQVPPAHFMEVPLDASSTPRPTAYWKPGLAEPNHDSIKANATRLRRMFLESVSLHLRSDVPLGCALSGGIDSSAIVGAIRHLSPSAEIHAFNYVADDERLSEAKWASIVATASGATLHQTSPLSGNLVEELESLIDSQEEPFGSISIFAQHRVFRLARENGIKVMLDGQGADELLGGYLPYLSARAATLARSGRLAKLAGFIRAASRTTGTPVFSILARTANYLLPPDMQEPFRKILGRQLTPSWLNMNWFRDRGVSPADQDYTPDRDVLHSSLLRTLTETSLPHLLRYEDRNSMAHSIESRVPFLLPEISDFALSLPEDQLISSTGTTKSVFRTAMRGIVPDPVLDRSDKIGFAVPDRKWLIELDPWVKNILKGGIQLNLPFINHAEMNKEWDAIAAGKRRFDLNSWRWVNFLEWARRFDAIAA